MGTDKVNDKERRELHAGELAKLLGDWRTLTIAEAEAIQLRNWEGLERLQQSKSRLTLDISQIDHTCEPALRPLINELIAMESENQQAISTARQGLECERVALEQSERTLRKVSTVYRADSRAGWQSYS